jgi:hypothetical protein
LFFPWISCLLLFQETSYISVLKNYTSNSVLLNWNQCFSARSNSVCNLCPGWFDIWPDCKVESGTLDEDSHTQFPTCWAQVSHMSGGGGWVSHSLGTCLVRYHKNWPLWFYVRRCNMLKFIDLLGADKGSKAFGRWCAWCVILYFNKSVLNYYFAKCT